MTPEPCLQELHDLVVVDLTANLAGAYCAKMFTDAGAIVTRIEGASGDPMRRWQWRSEEHTSELQSPC